MRILIVDDEPAMHESYRQCFRPQGGGEGAALSAMAAELFGDNDDADDNGDPGSKPSATPSAAQVSTQQALGLALEPLTAETRQQLRISDAALRGLVVSAVDPNSDAAQKGIQPGFVILAINQTPTATTEQASSIIEAARRAGRRTVLLQVRVDSGPPRYFGVDLTQSRPAR